MNEYIFAIPFLIMMFWLGIIFPYVSNFNPKLYIPYSCNVIIWILFMLFENVILFRISNFILDTIIISFLILGLKKVKITSNVWFYIVFLIYGFLSSTYTFSFLSFFNKGFLLPEYLKIEQNVLFQFLDNKIVLITLFIFVLFCSLPFYFLIRKILKNSRFINFSDYIQR